MSKQRSDLSLPAAIRIAQRYRVATPDEAEILGPVVSPHRCARASSAAVWTLSSCARLTCRRQGDVARYAVTWHCLARGRGRSPSVSGPGCASAGTQRSAACSCSPPGEAGGRHIQYHGTLLQWQPALRCGDQVVIIAATSSSVTLS